MNYKPRLIFVSILPPPSTGRSIVSKTMLEIFLDQNIFEVNILSISKKPGIFNGLWLFRKMFFSLRTIFTMIIKKGQISVYSASHDQLGLLEDFVISFIVKIKNWCLFYHHHNYSYINKYNWLMGKISKNIKKNGCHIFLCETMAQEFNQKYKYDGDYSIVTNAIIVDKKRRNNNTANHRHITNDEPLILGHLSNLSFDKGLIDVLRTTEKLIIENRKVLLKLAGPFLSKLEEEYFNNYITKYPENITYYGPLYGEEKFRFFYSLDIFLFPTKYRNEAQPLVIFEAMSCGVPTISYDRGCIFNMVGANKIGVIPQEKDFSEEAVKILINTDKVNELSANIIKDWERVKIKSRIQMEAVLEKVFQR